MSLTCHNKIRRWNHRNERISDYSTLSEVAAIAAHERRAKMAKGVQTLFPQTEDGHCAVCKEEITDNRKRRYCSDRCKDVAYATRDMFLWKKIRTQVLDKRENVCQRCGFNPGEAEEERQELKEEIEDEYEIVRNVHLERPPSLEVDHIKPVSKGGAVFDKDNLQILCEDCNREKSDKWDGEKDLMDFYELRRNGLISDEGVG